MGVAERRQREREERKEAILVAAEKVFLRKGVAAATMDEIAHQAELSKGTLYLYFRSKDELYLAIALRSLSELIERFESDAPRHASGLERLRGLLQVHTNFAREYPDRFRVAMNWVNADYSVPDSTESFAEYRKKIGRVFQFAHDAIEVGKKDGTIRTDIATPKLAMLVWGGNFGVMLLDASVQELARRMPESVIDGGLALDYIELILDAVASRVHGDIQESGAFRRDIA